MTSSSASGRSHVVGAPVRLAVVAALTAAVALAFIPLFGGVGHVPVVLGAAVVPFVATALSLLAPRPLGPLRVPLGLAGAVLVAVVGARPGGDLVDGPLRLLTGALPADPVGPELAAVALVVGMAAMAGAELAVVARQPVAAAVPAVLCLVVALAFGASIAQPPQALPAVLVGGIGTLLAVPAVAGAHDRRPAGPRLAGAGHAGARGPMATLAGACVVVVTAGALAWAIGGDAPGATARGGRFDARDLVAEPVLPRTSLSPLAAFADLRADRSEPLFTVRADRPIERLRVATLTRFDGHLWSAAGPHLRAGRTLPRGPAPPTGGTGARLEVEVVDAERATWLPTLGASGRAVEISVTGLGVDPATGDLVVPTDRPVPQAYRVVSHEPDLSVAALRGGVAAVPASSRDTALPTVLDQTHLPAIRDVVDAEQTSFAKVAALNMYFSRNGGFSRDDSEDAPSGHGLSQIERLLRTRRGTSEQYASAFAVVARRLGFDARVAVGFELESPAPAGEPVQLTGASVHAWPEVRFEELGWVPFEPTPTVVRPRARPGAAAPSASDRVEEAVDQEASRRRDGGARADTIRPATPRPRPVPAPARPLVAIAVGGLAIAVASGAVPPLVKALRRRRRRRAATSWLRVTGAWEDTVDRLVEHGVPVDPGMTSGEVTTAAATRVGRERTRGLRGLAVLADTASFAADGVAEADDVAAWELCDRLRRTLAAGVAPHHRVRHALDPRPLVRRPGRRARARVTRSPVSAGGRQTR